MSWIHTLRGLLTNIYNIPVTVEQAGLSVTFLQVQVLCQGTELRWGFKNKLINSMLTPGSTIPRYPDPHEPHALRLVNSIATALGNSAVQFATDQEFITSNLSKAIWELERRQYPVAWWSNQLKRQTVKNPETQPCWKDAMEESPWLSIIRPAHVLLPKHTPLPRFDLYVDVEPRLSAYK